MSARAGLVLLPGALLFGMTFPLVARIVFLGLGRIGRDLGGVYAANTLGGVFGSIAGGFLLVPTLGMRGTLLVLAATNAVLGGLCWVASSTGTRRFTLGAVAAGVAVLPAIVIPSTIFFDALEMGDFKLVYYREGSTDTTGVWESKTDGSRVVTYGDMRGTAGTSTDVPNRIQSHLAHLLHPAPKKSLQICFGVGNTLAAAALHPEVEQLDCVELSPHVRETAPFFWTNQGVLENPKVKLIVDDGRNYLLRTSERYDVITLEPPDIYNAGVVNLYTEEFYRLAANALTEDGIFCQWLPTAEMNEREMRMLVRSFANVFPETTLWLGAKTVLAPPLLLVGSKKPITIDPEALKARMQNGAVAADLQRLGIGDPEKLLDYYIAGSEKTRTWLGDAPPVTDDQTVVDFTTPRSVYSGFGLGYFVVAGKELEQHQSHRRWIAELYRNLREPSSNLLVEGRAPSQ